MRKSRFTESQIVAILKEGEAGVALSELTREGWDRPCDLLQRASEVRRGSVSGLKRMKGLEAWNAKNSGAD